MFDKSKEKEFENQTIIHFTLFRHYHSVPNLKLFVNKNDETKSLDQFFLY